MTTPKLIVRKARKEAHVLLRALYPLDLLPAAEYIRDNPPSPEAIAMLGFHVHEVLDKAQKSVAGSTLRSAPSIIEQLRKTGLQSLAEVREKAPKLYKRYSNKSLTQALSRIKRKKKLP